MPDQEVNKEQTTPWQALGFDTFEAYDKDKSERESKIAKQLQDRQAMIDRQASEIGSLRAEFDILKKKQVNVVNDGDTTSEPGLPGQPDASSEIDSLPLEKLENKLTEQQRLRAAEMLEGLEPENQAVITGSQEAQAAFLRHVIKTQAETPSVSFLDRLKAPKAVTSKSIETQIQELFNKQTVSNAMPTAAPTGVPGLSRTTEELKAAQIAAQKESVKNPVIRGGDLSGSLQALRQAKGN